MNPVIRSMNLKVRVKQGELAPEEALSQLMARATNKEQAGRSRTARWMTSPNALRRYKKANRS